MATGLLLGATACNRPPPSSCGTLADCEPEQHCLVDGESGAGRCVATPGRGDEPPPLRWLSSPPRTEVLLVVDDGPGTAALQARLLASLDALEEQIQILGDHPRVAVATASVSGPACAEVDVARRGAFTATSCLDRLEDFIGPDGTDARWLCTDHCEHTTVALGLSAERPWLEPLTLPADISPAAALSCLLPQGIAGCEYAAPLEATMFAWRRMALEGTPEHAFLRGTQPPRVVVLTDGVDCSLTEAGAAAFDPDGQRALWSDPEAAAATEAVCWHAGVSCEGDPVEFDDCVAVDRGLDGEPAAVDQEPVLFPLSEYERLFAEEQLLYVIAGVPVGEPREPIYSARGDPAWLQEHGVDPGCSDGEISALPPVRLRQYAWAITSACEANYSGTLRQLIAGEPLCLRPCEAAALELAYEAPGQMPVELPPCEGAYPALEPPPGAAACQQRRPESDNCAADPARSVELVLRTSEPDLVRAITFTPDLWSEEIELPGCE